MPPQKLTFDALVAITAIETKLMPMSIYPFYLHHCTEACSKVLSQSDVSCGDGVGKAGSCAPMKLGGLKKKETTKVSNIQCVTAKACTGMGEINDRRAGPFGRLPQTPRISMLMGAVLRRWMWGDEKNDRSCSFHGLLSSHVQH